MSLAADSVAEILGRHLPIYRIRRPVYQTVMLETLRRLWGPGCRTVLDVGGGTGVIAQAIHGLFSVEKVVSIDVEDRYLDSLTIEHATYDGRRLPFEAASFDCILFNNVIHHVLPQDRLPLLRECRRVAPRGVLLIKDHLAASWLDHLRLTVLDVIGNTPFHGMVKASYLTHEDWRHLAEAAGYRIERSEGGRYRSGLLSLAFPNRLETTMRWAPA